MLGSIKSNGARHAVLGAFSTAGGPLVALVFHLGLTLVDYAHKFAAAAALGRGRVPHYRVRRLVELVFHLDAALVAKKEGRRTAKKEEKRKREKKEGHKNVFLVGDERDGCRAPYNEDESKYR